MADRSASKTIAMVCWPARDSPGIRGDHDCVMSQCDSELHSVARGGTRRHARHSGITSIVRLQVHPATLKSTTSGSSLQPASGQVVTCEISVETPYSIVVVC